MVATYPAPLPDPRSFDWDEPENWGPRLWCRLTAKTKDVFETYYAARDRSKKSVRKAPHELFAQSPDDPKSIRTFSATWGLLFSEPDLGPPVFDLKWKSEKRLEWEQSHDPNWCGMNILEWQECHRVFKKMMELSRSKRPADQKKLTELFASQPMTTFPSGRKYPPLPSKIKPQIRYRNGAAQSTLAPSSLWEAFCLMLWLDLATGGLRLLKCPHCEELFATEKRNQKYCGADCTQAASKRKWWKTKGNDWRRRRTAGSFGNGAPESETSGSPVW